jgi:Ca-activated chloride channel family protein
VFRDNPTTFNTQRVEASASNKTAAIEFLKGVQSRGQTDVYNAIKPVLQEPPRPGIPGIVLLLSDGRPTAGVRDARTIINSLSSENELGNTIFAYGGGNTVDRYLLDLLALRNKGDSFVSKDISGISKDLPAFFGSFKEPLLVQLRTDFGNIDDSQVFPKAVPERAVTVYGRFDPASQKEFAMRLTGEAEFQRKEVIFKADLSEAGSGQDDIARNWALNKVYYLIGEMCRVGEKPELLAEVRELSRTYGIKTSYDE